MLGALAEEGLSAKSRRNIHGVLHKALADAKRWELVVVNVASGAELPRVPDVAPRAWTMSELARLLERAQTERLAKVWQFIAQTGCRRAEAAGVRWRDIDLEARTATFVNTRPIAGGSVAEGEPKTRSGGRTIALDDDVVAMLRAWRAEQRAELFALGLRSDSMYVFTGEDGGPYWPQRITARFRDVTDELGLPPIGPHGLRHTSITWAIASGQNPKLVAQRHGHSSSSFTIARYSHVQPGHDRAAADAYAEAIRRVNPACPRNVER
jgi:integrase